MPENKLYSNFREKFVDGIKEVIRNGKVNVDDLPALCSVTYPFVKPETTIDILKSLKKLKLIKIDKDGIVSIIL